MCRMWAVGGSLAALLLISQFTRSVSAQAEQGVETDSELDGGEPQAPAPAPQPIPESEPQVQSASTLEQRTVDAETREGSGSEPEESQDESDDERARPQGAAAAEKALASTPAVRPSRGGSLGLPAGDVPSLSGQFAARATFGAANVIGADYFVQAGHLQLGAGASLSVLSETLDIDVPAATLSVSEPRQPLTRLARQTYASLGFRFAYTFFRGRPIDRSQAAFEERFRQCMELRRILTEEGVSQVEHMPAGVAARAGVAEGRTACDELNLEMTGHTGTGEDARGALLFAKRNQYNGVTLYVGGRLMASAFDQLDAGEALGVAGEAGLQLRYRSLGFSLGGQVAYVTDRTLAQMDVSVVRHLGVVEWGGTVAVSYEGDARAVEGIELAPRAGLYYRLTANSWRNEFAAPGMATDIVGMQHEVGVYASGHFAEGFSGLVGISTLVPYGADHFDDLTWVVTFTPAFGEPVGADAGDES